MWRDTSELLDGLSGEAALRSPDSRTEHYAFS